MSIYTRRDNASHGVVRGHYVGILTPGKRLGMLKLHLEACATTYMGE